MQISLATREPDQMVMFHIEFWTETQKVPMIRQYLDRHDVSVGSPGSTQMHVHQPQGVAVYRKVTVMHPAHLPNVGYLLIHLIRECEK